MRKFLTVRSALLASLMATASVCAIAAGEHDHSPKFGGVVVETKAGDVEIVAKPDSIQIYITDHSKAVKLDGAKAKVTLLNGTEKSEAELVPIGDRLQANGAFKVTKGTKGIVVVTLLGKPPVAARFDIK